MDQRRGIVMTSDGELLDALLRLAAAAGIDLTRTADVADTRRLWAHATIVLLDPAAAALCAQARLPRRTSVVVAVRGDPPPQAWQEAVAIGAEHVVSLPDAEPWLVAALADTTAGAHGRGRVLAVVGGRGGAGASVLAAATALGAARRADRSLLVDLDPLGGGVDLLFGAEDVEGLRWPELSVGSGRLPAAALRAALPEVPDLRLPRGHDGGELGVLSCGRCAHGPTAAAVQAVLEAGRRAGETVVCDVPRYPTPAATAALGGADLVVLVVPADVRSCAAAAQVAGVIADHGATARAVVRGPSPGGIDAAEVERALEIPLLAAMRPEPGLDRSLERGRPPGATRGPLATAAGAVLDALREQAEAGAP